MGRPLSSILLGALAGLLILGGHSAEMAAESGPNAEAFRLNRALGRGVNLGNALEAPQEGAWGIKLEADYFPAIRAAGFQAVRVPINWAAHAESNAPYAIDPAFFARVDWVIDQALEQKLAVIVNAHHYEEMFTAPAEHLPRLIGIWRQIAERYRRRPEQVYFELLNEPHGKLDDELWNAMIPQLLAVIRPTNPRRAVIVGPTGWNGIWKLEKLRLPADDHGTIATVHYYNPFEFTHQGASWTAGSEKWLGRTWTGSPAERRALEKEFATAAAWSRKHDRPMFLGEFGAYSKAPMDSRAAWTRAVVAEAERNDFSWSYWEFAAGFGVYDPAARAWREPLLQALLAPAR